jgi:peptidoglycan/LPS O-acetylase OafA/YrhL
MLNPHFPSWLTASRGFFATWIVLRHLSANSMGPASWILDYLPRLKTFDIPTTYFFMLSGLIFTLGKTHASGFASIRHFWFARIGRLYPLYLLAVVFSAPIGWKFSGGDWDVFLRNGLAEMTLTQGWLFEQGHSWLTVGWFMSSVAFCYFFYPVLAPPIQRRSVGFLAFLILGLGALTLALGIHVDEKARTDAIAETVRRTPAFPLLLFVQGIAAGELLNRGRRVALLPIGLALLIGGAWVIMHETPNGHHYLVGGALWLLPLVLLSYVPVSAPASLVSYGELGFTLYMLHWPIYIYSRGLLKAAGLAPWLTSPVYLVLILSVIILLSRWVYNNFERPIQDRIRKLARAS